MAVAESENSGVAKPEIAAIGELFVALESQLLTYAWRLVGQRAAAEDVVQDAFLKLHAHFGEVREPRHWLYRTVHNLALNHQRRTAKLVSLEPAPGIESASVEEVDPQPLPDEQIARWEGIGLVRLSLAALDARDQELIRLKFCDGLSYQEMSAKTGLSVSNVGYLLHHALKTIAAELGQSGIV
jgi:RNA polymerase sigma-70 factor (ECF subfamily)